MSMLKKILVSILIFVVLFTSTPTPAKADGEWYAPYPMDWYLKAYDTSNANSIFGERYTAAQVTWVVYSILFLPITIIIGPSLTTCIVKVVNAVPKNLIDLVKLKPEDFGDPINSCSITIQDKIKNLLGSINVYGDSSMLAIITSPREPSIIAQIPAVLNKGFSLDIVPVAKAQTPGFGFGALLPIQILWKFARNATYAFFVIIIIVLSFMVMFKVKLNPQTVITIQSAIPKIVIALILVTFSYAIAGLLIDLMYLVFALISAIVSPLFIHGLVPSISPDSPANIFGWLIGSTFPLGYFGIISFVLWIVGVVLMIPILIIGLLLAAPTGTISFWISLGLIVIIFLVLVIHVFKVIWALVKAYAFTLLLTIISPFYIALGVIIPSFGIGPWIRLFVANLSTFIVTSLMTLLSIEFFLMGVTSLGFIASPFGLGSAVLEVLPFGFGTNAGWPPVLGGGGAFTSAIIISAVGLVMFTLIPKANEIIQALIKGQQFNYGSAIGETINPMNIAGYGASYGAAKASDFISTSKWAEDNANQAKFINTVLGTFGKFAQGGFKSR